MKKLLLCFSLFMASFVLTTTDTFAQSKKPVPYEQRKPTPKVAEAINEYIAELPIAPDFEMHVYTSYYFEKGEWYVYIDFITRFIDDDWGGWAVPAEATVVLNGGGKIKSATIHYPLGQ